MSKKLKPGYIARATELEIDLTGDETIDALKELIQQEMESLGTWDGDHFADKAEEAGEEPAEEPTEEPAEEAGEEAGEDKEEDEEGEPAPEEEAEEEAKELSKEELVALMEKNAAALEELTVKELQGLCEDLEISKGGKEADLLDRLCEYDEHNAQQLAAALEAAGYGVEEITKEAEEARKERERRNLLASLKGEGVQSLIQTVRLLTTVGELEDALGVAQMGEELWPESTDLKDRRKSIETQIKERDAAASAYELQQQQQKLEAKNRGRGRKKKVASIQDCRDACNDLIIVTQDAAKGLRSQGKGDARLRYAVTLLGRMLKNQYR